MGVAVAITCTLLLSACGSSKVLLEDKCGDIRVAMQEVGNAYSEDDMVQGPGARQAHTDLLLASDKLKVLAQTIKSPDDELVLKYAEDAKALGWALENSAYDSPLLNSATDDILSSAQALSSRCS